MARMSRFLISAAIVGIAVAGNFEQEKEAAAEPFVMEYWVGISSLPGYTTAKSTCPETELLNGHIRNLGLEGCKQRCLLEDTCFYCTWNGADYCRLYSACSDAKTSYVQYMQTYFKGVAGDFEQEEEEEQSGCRECVTTFMAVGGCDDFDNDALVPPGCDYCGEAAWEACGKPGDFGQEEEEEEQSGCGECVIKFMAAGGCDDFDNDALIPPGCDAATCGEAAWEACGRPGDNIYGFEDVCVGLKSKKCKKQDTCEYKNKQCVSIDMPIDVCVGLKSKKCKKQDTCEYKNKQCVKEKYIDMPVDPMDVCVGLKSKKCKKQDMCEYKNKQCVSIDEPIDVCVGLKSKKCKKQDTCEYKRKQKQCVMI